MKYSGKISNNVAKSTILDEMISTGDKPENIIKKLGLTQISDRSEIEDFCKKAMEANPKAVADIKAGQGKAMGALVGGVIKISGGKANPKMVNDILNKLLLQ